MNFIKYYIEGHTLKQCALATSMEYSAAVNWGSFIRELFMGHVHLTYQHIKFNSDVEIDESRKENPQKPTQLSSRSHPRHLVGKRTAQKTPS